MVNKKLLFVLGLFINLGYCKASEQVDFKLKSSDQKEQGSDLMKFGKFILAGWIGNSILYNLNRFYKYSCMEKDEGAYVSSEMNRVGSMATFDQKDSRFHRLLSDNDYIGGGSVSSGPYAGKIFWAINFDVNKEILPSYKSVPIDGFFFYRMLNHLGLISNNSLNSYYAKIDNNKISSAAFILKNLANIASIYMLFDGTFTHGSGTFMYDSVYHPKENPVQRKVFGLGLQAFRLYNAYISVEDIFKSFIEYKKSLERKTKKSIV